jgi:hypothetical protein
MSNQNGASAVSTIPEAVEAVKAQTDEISPSQLAHLQRVHIEAEQAKINLQQAVALQQASIGARQSFMEFLFAEYALGDGDTIELETGKITHKS